MFFLNLYQCVHCALSMLCNVHCAEMDFFPLIAICYRTASIWGLNMQCAFCTLTACITSNQQQQSEHFCTEHNVLKPEIRAQSTDLNLLVVTMRINNQLYGILVRRDSLPIAPLAFLPFPNGNKFQPGKDNKLQKNVHWRKNRKNCRKMQRKLHYSQSKVCSGEEKQFLWIKKLFAKC